MIKTIIADAKHFRIITAFILGILVGSYFRLTGCLDTAEEPATFSSYIPYAGLTTIPPSTSRNSKNNGDEIHMLYGLSGMETSFFDEFYVSLKSVLLNAPTDIPLSIHCLADKLAYNRTVTEISERIRLDNLIARQPISINVYNIESKGFAWKKVIERSTGHKTSKRHTMGTFFRLFAYDVLPPSVEHAVYLDTDIVITTNLQELWKYRNSSSMFQWGLDTRCAGFMLLNVRQMGISFWELVNTTYPKDKLIPVLHKINDQQIVRNFFRRYPEQVSALPPEWNNHKSDNFYQLNGNLLLKNRPKMGMLHFNGHGKGGGTVNVFEEPKRKEYSVVHYHVHHPWQWVGYMLQSQLPPGTTGYPVSLNFKVV